MKIVEIRAAALKDPTVLGRTPSQPAAWKAIENMHPLGFDPSFTGQSARFAPPWNETICVAKTDDGTFGVGMTSQAGPVVPVINDYFGPMLAGESALDIERLWTMMTKSANAHFGAWGLASFAISAVDLALWDLKGKLVGQPVYDLIGGPARERTRCYGTGNDIDDLQERGFDAFKLACPTSPGAGKAGLDLIEELVAGTRRRLGDDADLMLDCWAVLDVAYSIEIGERLQPYGLRWLEDYLEPDDWAGYNEVRRRLPQQGLASGERWYTDRPFQQAAEQHFVDVFQPDVEWVGGATAVLRIAAIAGRRRYRAGRPRRRQRLVRATLVSLAAGKPLGRGVRRLRAR